MSAILSNLPKLRFEANRAMWSAWHGANLHRGTPNEVACIRNLVQVGLPEVEAAWKKTLASIGVKGELRGVVCHGHPWVRHQGAAIRCELGDFLLVHDHQPDGGPPQRRAVIVQAKVFHVHGVRAKNHVQLELYQNWQPFVYESWPGGIHRLDEAHVNAGLKGSPEALRERDIRKTGVRGAPPASSALLDNGCRYGMIDVKYSRWGDPLINMNPWRLCSAQAADVYTSKAGLTLGSYLVNLMAGTVGRHVPETAWPKSVKVACHWSLMVTELLSILPATPISTSGGTKFLSATPNLNIVTTSLPDADKESSEGGFGVIQLRTFGDLGSIDHRRE